MEIQARSLATSINFWQPLGIHLPEEPETLSLCPEKIVKIGLLWKRCLNMRVADFSIVKFKDPIYIPKIFVNNLLAKSFPSNRLAQWAFRAFIPTM